METKNVVNGRADRDAGRIVMIKSVAQAIPSFIMQTMMLSRGTLARMDKMIRDFFWGFKDSYSHNMYLKSWNSICLPKELGGLGIRSMIDINAALLSKMAWKLCVIDDKPWAQLIHARYLRGRNMLEVNRFNTASSWLWSSLRKCMPILHEGACIQIGANSETYIRDIQ